MLYKPAKNGIAVAMALNGASKRSVSSGKAAYRIEINRGNDGRRSEMA